VSAVGDALGRLEHALDALELSQVEAVRRDRLADARRELAAVRSALRIAETSFASPHVFIDDDGGPQREPDDVEEHRRP